jgi:hypothetical protein
MLSRKLSPARSRATRANSLQVLSPSSARSFSVAAIQAQRSAQNVRLAGSSCVETASIRPLRVLRGRNRPSTAPPASNQVATGLRPGDGRRRHPGAGRRVRRDQVQGSLGQGFLPPRNSPRSDPVLAPADPQQPPRIRLQRRVARIRRRTSGSLLRGGCARLAHRGQLGRRAQPQPQQVPRRRADPGTGSGERDRRLQPRPLYLLSGAELDERRREGKGAADLPPARAPLSRRFASASITPPS